MKHPWPIPKQTAAMPLSEPMKAAIMLAIRMAIVMAVVAAVLAVLGEAIANAAQVLASALGANQSLPTLVLEASQAVSLRTSQHFQRP